MALMIGTGKCYYENCGERERRRSVGEKESSERRGDEKQRMRMRKMMENEEK